MTGAEAHHRDRPRARSRTAFGRLLGCSRAVSAVEFALLAPVLIIGAFATADAGLAIYERTMMGQSLRAAAQLGMAGAEVDHVRAVLREVASENFVLAADGTTQDGSLSVDVSSYCACPGQGFAEVDCSVTCDAGEGASEFYRLTASKTFEGVFLPSFALGDAVSIMVP